jgi:glucan biosynthesis protein C
MSQDSATQELTDTPDRHATKPRLHGLDALRGGALMLGILIHAMLPFIPGFPFLVTDPTSSMAVVPLFFLIHLFRMTLFMMLAGYFGAMVLGHRGPWPYLKDRTKRILLPAVVFWPVSVGTLGLLAMVNVAWRGVPPPPPESASSELGLLEVFNPGQLWFLWTLTQIVVIVLLARTIAYRCLGADRVRGAVAGAGDLLASPGGVLLAAVPYLVGLLIQWDLSEAGITGPETILPELASLVAYTGAFLVGWALYRGRDTLPRLSERWIPYMVLAVVTSVPAVATLMTLGELLPVPVGSVLVAVAGSAWTYGLLGLCTRYLRRERPVVRYLADASYWAYLMHLPLLVLGQILIADLPWPALVKLTVNLGATTAVLLVSYHLVVRSTFLGRWLNGKRHPFRLRPGSRPRGEP